VTTNNPAEFTITKSTFKTLGQYAFVSILCLLILTWVMQLWRADFKVPFMYFVDSLFYNIATKGTIEHGWWLHNQSLGAPAGLTFEGYPALENFHWAVIKLISLFTADHALVLNIFYLLTFPLTAITSFYFLRHFKFSFGTALVVSLLYSFLPYHFFQSYHLMMAAYYLVPLMVLVIMWICLEDRLQGRKAIASIAICLIAGSCGVYYPYFFCFLLLAAGLFSSWNRCSYAPLVAALVLAGVVAGTLVINHLPTIIYQRTHGSAAMGSRSVGDAEIMGLKITQLLLPIGGHRNEKLAALKHRYNLGPLINENDTSSLGIVGSIGFLLLLGAIFSRQKMPGLLQALSGSNLAAVLLGTIGGLGVLFNLLVSPQIRAYTRISVFIAFFSLIGVAWLLDTLFKKLSTPPLRVVYHVGLAVVLVVGVLDQTTTTFFFVPEYEKNKRDYESDADFVSRIEASLPPHAMVFQLPYMPFPESPPLHQMRAYEHYKAYLHSKTLRWSYGVPPGEQQDKWQQSVAAQPPPELLNSVRAAGFSGIYVNLDGYEDRGAKLKGELTSALGVEPIVNREGNLVFFNLDNQ
jgi:phosphoglycerol transferase